MRCVSSGFARRMDRNGFACWWEVIVQAHIGSHSAQGSENWWLSSRPTVMEIEASFLFWAGSISVAYFSSINFNIILKYSRTNLNFAHTRLPTLLNLIILIKFGVEGYKNKSRIFIFTSLKERSHSQNLVMDGKVTLCWYTCIERLLLVTFLVQLYLWRWVYWHFSYTGQWQYWQWSQCHVAVNVWR